MSTNQLTPEQKEKLRKALHSLIFALVMIGFNILFFYGALNCIGNVLDNYLSGEPLGFWNLVGVWFFTKMFFAHNPTLDD